ncbi:hypothetical protein [Pedobacter aquatilis]|uniref:hypothetical protein n=1 Tax=Pedobacter aquatilis TaxID=351343 RepID=UPI0029313A71|nr:hypothetical protein [Pedobacter aquatilis]
MKFIYSFLLLFISLAANAQLDSIYKQLIISECDSSNIKPLSEAMAAILPDKSVYLRGETHDIRSNNISFSSLFLGLHERRGVNYILVEYSHSYFFMFNLFLKSGDVRILAELDKKLDLDSLSLRRYYSSAIALYKYNLKQPRDKKIRFIGIDIDLQNAWKRTEIQNNYKLAIRNFEKYSVGVIPQDILILFEKVAKESDYRLLNDLNNRLIEVSAMHVEELKRCFGDFYPDYYLIINSIKVLPGVYRDKQLLTNFETAVEAIRSINPTENPKFFGSFGCAHVEPGINNSFGSVLNRSKKFKDEVSFIGSGYYNSLCTYDKLKPIILQGASLPGLSKSEQVKANLLVSSIAQSQKRDIVLLSKFHLLPDGKFDFLKHYDAFIIYNGF